MEDDEGIEKRVEQTIELVKRRLHEVREGLHVELRQSTSIIPVLVDVIIHFAFDRQVQVEDIVFELSFLFGHLLYRQKIFERDSRYIEWCYALHVFRRRLTRPTFPVYYDAIHTCICGRDD